MLFNGILQNDQTNWKSLTLGATIAALPHRACLHWGFSFIWVCNMLWSALRFGSQVAHNLVWLSANVHKYFPVYEWLSVWLATNLSAQHFRRHYTIHFYCTVFVFFCLCHKVGWNCGTFGCATLAACCIFMPKSLSFILHMHTLIHTHKYTCLIALVAFELFNLFLLQIRCFVPLM